MSNGKIMIIHWIAGLKKRLSVILLIVRIKISQKNEYKNEPFGGDVNVKVDLSNYATKIDMKNISHVNTSSFALKSNLARLKTEVDKLDIDKLKNLPNNLSN